MAGSVAAAAPLAGPASSPRPPPPAPPPPRLRQALHVLPAEPDPDGAPAWLLHDPAANTYFRVGAVELDLLALVDGRSAEAVAAEAWERFRRRVSVEEVEALFAVLRSGNLVEADAVQRQRHAARRAARPGMAKRLMKGYISFRIPLVRPDRFLGAALPWVRWLGSWWVAAALVLMGAAGLYLALRQIDVFLASAVGFVSMEGLAGYAAAIVVVKIAHELGHAFAAKARGLRVPTMGVAFIVFWPIAYTDTTDAWRLTRRRDRLAVGAGGVAVELAIAAVCLFLWNLAPDGPVRSLLFLLATTSWVFSLLVNLNPLMRFDGYFLFSDLTGVINLEQKGHASARYWLRRLVFGWDEPLSPDPPRRRYALFGVAVWLYRLVLFFGIALAVYHLFFKALGLLLFAVEIAYFILGPIWREVTAWTARAGQVRLNGALLRTLTVLGLVVAVLAVPWRATLVVPGVLRAEVAPVFMPEPARIEAVLVAPGQAVAAGTPLVLLAAPHLTHALEQAIRRHDELVLEQASLGVDALRRERAAVIAAAQAAERRRIEGLRARLDHLTLTAGHDGIVRSLHRDLRAGTWMPEGERLLDVVAATAPAHVTAYVPEIEVGRLGDDATATFHPEDGLSSVAAGTVTRVDAAGTATVPEILAGSHGGPVAVRRDPAGAAVPLGTLYTVDVRLDAAEALPATEVRGRVVIDAAPHSLAERMWRRLLGLLVRESGL